VTENPKVSTHPNKQLGICIPAYHRPDQLERCLLSVIAAAKEFSVPTFVTDDAEDFANRSVIEKIKRHYPFLVYYKNPRRLGLEHNILNAATKCTAEYCWLLGEDDRMEPEAIATVLRALQEATEPPLFLFVNYRYVDANISRVLRERVLPVCKDTCISSDIFLQRYSWAMGFLGSCIFQRQLLTQADANAYLGTHFVHVGFIMESIAGKAVIVIAEPLVRNRVGGAEVFSWSEHCWDVFHGWDVMIDRLAAHYPPEVCNEAKNAFHRAMGIGTLRFLCARRADGLYHISYLRHSSLLRSQWRGSKRLGAFLIALTPPFVFKLAKGFVELQRKFRCRSIEDVPRFPEKDPGRDPAFNEIAHKEV